MLILVWQFLLFYDLSEDSQEVLNVNLGQTSAAEVRNRMQGKYWADEQMVVHCYPSGKLNSR
jgi:hypothetical protein